MSRPTYENEETLRLEKALMEKVANAWDVDLYKNKKSAIIDCSIASRKSREIIAFAELRCRPDTRVRQYRTFMSGVSKVTAAQSLNAIGMGYNVYYIVEWQDAIGWFDILTTPIVKLEWGGRDENSKKYRGDDDDMEAIAHWEINEKDFNRLEKVPLF